MLELVHIFFRYNQSFSWIISDFNLTVSPGEIVGITGKSGRGKTTLGKIMAGYIRSHTGDVRYGGTGLPAKGYSPVQMIFQHPETSMNPRWKVKKTLREVEGFIPPESLLGGLSINPMWLERYPHELSGGEMQRIAVARVLNPKTRYIIADEMTSMLDPVTQAQIWNTVIRFGREQGAGIIAISHDRDLLDTICNRQISLD